MACLATMRAAQRAEEKPGKMACLATMRAAQRAEEKPGKMAVEGGAGECSGSPGA